MPSPAYRSGSVYQSGSVQVGSVALPKPSGVVAGDVLVALAGFLYTVDNPSRTIAPPAGFTQLQHSNIVFGGSYQGIVTLFAKIADGSEASTMNFTLSGSDLANCLGVMLAIQDAAGVGASGKLEQNAASNTVQTPDITGAAECLDIRMCIHMYGTGTYTAPAGYTARDTVYNSYLGSRIPTATKLQTAGGAYGQKGFLNAGSVTGMQLGLSILARGPQETTDAATVSQISVVEHWDVHEGSGTIYTDTGTKSLTLTGSSVDGMEYTDSATATLTLTPSGVDGLHYTDAATATLAFTPITTHECRTHYVVTMEVMLVQNRWNATNTMNKYNNATSRTRWYITYVGVEPSVSDC